MKNFMKLLEAMRSIAIISLALVIGFSMAACGDDDGGGGSGDVTFNVTNNYSAKAVKVETIRMDGSDKKITDISIAAGGKGSFTIPLTKDSAGEYSGTIRFAFEDAQSTFVGLDSFTNPKPTIGITIDDQGEPHED